MIYMDPDFNIFKFFSRKGQDGEAGMGCSHWRMSEKGIQFKTKDKGVSFLSQKNLENYEKIWVVWMIYLNTIYGVCVCCGRGK